MTDNNKMNQMRERDNESEPYPEGKEKQQEELKKKGHEI